MPHSVAEIGRHAFAHCHKLTYAAIADSVTEIGEHAFAWCKRLTHITIPKHLKHIGQRAFKHCQSLTHAVIPPGLTEIPPGMFVSCKNLIAVHIPEGVTAIRENAFSECRSLTKITLPESLESIDDYAFRKSGLVEIIIPENVTYIGKNAFEGCKTLTAAHMTDSVQYIGGGAFADCKRLTVHSPKNSYAFKYCRKRIFGKINWTETSEVSGFMPIDLDESVDARYTEFLSEMHNIKRQVKAPDLLKQIDRLGNAVKIICKHLAESPEVERMVSRRIPEYYLPEALKLIRTHIEAYSGDKPFTRPTEIIRGIPHAISGIADAVELQLESLNATNTVDLTSDLDVLDYMLKLDGVKRQ